MCTTSLQPRTHAPAPRKWFVHSEPGNSSALDGDTYMPLLHSIRLENGGMPEVYHTARNLAQLVRRHEAAARHIESGTHTT